MKEESIGRREREGEIRKEGVRPLSRGQDYHVPEGMPVFEGTDRMTYGMVSITSYCQRCGKEEESGGLEPRLLSLFLRGEVGSDELNVEMSDEVAYLHLLKVCSSCATEDDNLLFDRVK